ncbi:hypothetical protein H5410_057157 [Solanum commersonii]|uniref:Uncharacterized protein n=1 Tax=Solanum commersonii TaxID=4109 RepID=A0A9J5WPA6_SOLCO|nr:hypothetical protein H5410_057157 [Solanum commersonii]
MVAQVHNHKDPPREAKVGSAVSLHSNYVKEGVFRLLERYYKYSVPDSIVATFWFTGNTKKSHAYVTVIDGLIILDHENPVALPVSIPITIVMINLLVLCHKNLESVSW